MREGEFEGILREIRGESPDPLSIDVRGLFEEILVEQERVVRVSAELDRMDIDIHESIRIFEEKTKCSDNYVRFLKCCNALFDALCDLGKVRRRVEREFKRIPKRFVKRAVYWCLWYLRTRRDYYVLCMVILLRCCCRAGVKVRFSKRVVSRVKRMVKKPPRSLPSHGTDIIACIALLNETDDVKETVFREVRSDNWLAYDVLSDMIALGDLDAAAEGFSVLERDRRDIVRWTIGDGLWRAYRYCPELRENSWFVNELKYWIKKSWIIRDLFKKEGLVEEGDG